LKELNYQLNIEYDEDTVDIDFDDAEENED